MVLVGAIDILRIGCRCAALPCRCCGFPTRHRATRRRVGRALFPPDRSRRSRAQFCSTAEVLTGSPDFNSRHGRFPSTGWRVMTVLAFHSFRHSAASLEAAIGGERPLSARAATMSIATLSMLGWAVVLLPLWVLAQ